MFWDQFGTFTIWCCDIVWLLLLLLLLPYRLYMSSSNIYFPIKGSLNESSTQLVLDSAKAYPQYEGIR